MDDDEPKRGVRMKLAPEWLSSVKGALKEREWTQTELAKRAGLSGDPMVSRMLGGTASTLTVSAVSRTLGIPDPVEQLKDPVIQSWIYAGMQLRKLDPEQFAEVHALVANIVKTRDQFTKVRGLADPHPRKK